MDTKEKEFGKKLAAVLSDDEIDYLETLLEKSYMMKLFEDCTQGAQDLIRDEINELYLEELDKEEDFENDDYDDDEEDDEE